MRIETQNKVEDVLFWIGIPTICLTENSPKKWVRLLGFFGTIPLFPMALLWLALQFVWIIICIIDEI